MRRRFAAVILLLAAATILLGGQAALFHASFATRLAAADRSHYELLRGQSAGGRLRDVDDPYRAVSESLADIPFYLLPTGAWIADRYHETTTFNRALYLARTGEIGTARVLVNGLQATAEDPGQAALGSYLLGRLQYEVFRTRPEPELHRRTVDYLRQSLIADPDAELPRRFLDYVLSLPQTTSVLEVGAGAPAGPSDGENVDVFADDREF